MYARGVTTPNVKTVLKMSYLRFGILEYSESQPQINMKSHHSPERNPDPATTYLVRKLPAKELVHTQDLYILFKETSEKIWK